MNVLRAAAVVALVAGAFPSYARAAAPDQTQAHAASAFRTPMAAFRPPGNGPPGKGNLRAWREKMIRTPLPYKGCFAAAYPETQWRRIRCVAAPSYPMPPRVRPLSPTVGNGHDLSVEAPAGPVSRATGSFDSVGGVTAERSRIANAGAPVADAYTLQLNTNVFKTTVCPASRPVCRGWQQFVFENNDAAHRLYIQYWLFGYGAGCPHGGDWHRFAFGGSGAGYCWKNDSAGAAPVPAQPIANLARLSLTGVANAFGDNAYLSTGRRLYAVTGDDAVRAYAGWRIAEFNVFGDGGNGAGGSRAVFNDGATIVTRTRITYHGAAPPVCVATGFTAESNNLHLRPGVRLAPPPEAALVFSQGAAAVSPRCEAATTASDGPPAVVHRIGAPPVRGHGVPWLAIWLAALGAGIAAAVGLLVMRKKRAERSAR